MPPLKRKQRTMEKFHAKYAINPTTGCWEWAASINNQGYGTIRVAYRLQLAHRFAYERFVGPIPDGLVLDHLCKNTKCCNPEHLQVVTQQINILRGDSPAALHARTTHCPRGHEYNAENTILRRGKRECRECKRARDAARRAAA